MKNNFRVLVNFIITLKTFIIYVMLMLDITKTFYNCHNVGIKSRTKLSLSFDRLKYFYRSINRTMYLNHFQILLILKPKFKRYNFYYNMQNCGIYYIYREPNMFDEDEKCANGLYYILFSRESRIYD